jgi:hypothetical protein
MPRRAKVIIVTLEDGQNPSPKDNYRARQISIALHLEKINKAMIHHAAEFERTKCKDWGYIGDLDKVKDDLEEIENFLTRVL